MGNSYQQATTPDTMPVGKSRARKRAKGAPTHVRSWPLRPAPTQCREIRTRFFTGARVYNAVLDEFIARCRAVKADPAWQAARELPHRSPAERQVRRAAFRSVQAAHGFTADAAQSLASSLRRSWVREHLPAQETQSLGARAFDAVCQWHVGTKGKPRFKSKRGLRSLAAKDGNGALRPNTDDAGRLIGLQWGAGFVVPIAAPAQTGRRGKEQRAELAEIEALIAAGKVLSTRIVRTVINGRDTYRMQLVCDGRPTRRHPVGDGRVSFDLGPSQIAVALERSDGAWVGWVEPLADRIRLNTLRLRRAQRRMDRAHRAGSPGCFNPDGTHKTGRCDWQQRSRAATQSATVVAEQHRRLAQHRKTLHGALANRLLAHGGDVVCEKLNYVSWQKNFPRTVRDRAPGLLVETIRRKAESAGGGRLYQYSPYTTALSQTCLCGTKKKKPLSQRVHRCGCGIKEDRDLFSAYLGLHVRTQADGRDRLDLPSARAGWWHRQDVDEPPKSSRSAQAHKRRGRRHPPSRRSVARIKARRKAKTAIRQSRSARTSTTDQPTALLAA
ncbi:transposase [Mycobacterium sp. SM1]|uniref:transposase n=1 Tax=Mycobacterium sp. SM1 TaxID=2816243 RepID=UPI0027DDAC91|nr:transposase [Mycobacterium sp. SM1]